jgi:beta-glucanase (GH16 family)
MKTRTLTLSILMLNGLLARGNPVNAADAPEPYAKVVQGYHLAWSDEFDGNTLDLSKWTYRTDSKMWSTQLPANDSVSDGTLIIALKKETAAGKQYTGGGIISKKTFLYGYYEARFRVPPGAGWHTSFWTMSTDGSGTTKPGATQELDICEQNSVNLTDYSAGIFAWGDHGKQFGRKYIHTPDLHAEFHVWGCEFTPETVKFYFDGRLTHQTDAKVFKQGPQSIWLTCIASALENTPAVDDKQLPATAEFDYVRYFSRTDTKRAAGD